TIQHLEYRDKPSLKRTVQDTQKITASINQQARAQRIVQRISGPVMLSTAGESYGASFIAFDPVNEDEDTLSLLAVSALVEGKQFADSKESGIILGRRLAENLGADLGDKIVYTLTDKSGEIVSGLARLVGIIKTGSPGMDGALTLLPLDAVRKTLGYAPGEVTQLAVFIEDQRLSDAVAEQLGSVIEQDNAVLPWHINQPELATMVALDKGSARFMEGLIALLVAAGIFNTLFVSVMERLREFGILLAIGFTPIRLFFLVMFESLWLALLGLIGAAIVTIGPYLYLESTGIDMSSMVDTGGAEGIDVAGIAMPTVLKVGIFPENLIFIGVAALVATLLAGLYPAWRASSVEPVQAIKLV
ncbi:MAG: FtsX-like permease family protein, partial [Pseudomonadota bacterium]